LERVEVDESLLHGMEFAGGFGETFNGRDAPPVRHDRQGQAGKDPASIDMNRAGPALSVIAAFLCARQRDMIAQRVEERRPRIESKGMAAVIDVE
jgi:hypothetical protein